MNHILIDTKTGRYGVMHGRPGVEQETGGQITKNFLWNLFSISRKNRSKKKTYVNDRFIVLPYKSLNVMEIDEELIGRIKSS